jgi:hypothetical protein
MIIQLNKFGKILNSRPSGKEASLAFRPILLENEKGEEIIIDFNGVEVLSPSWADEFITPIFEEYGDKVSFKNTSNASVQATLKILDLHLK